MRETMISATATETTDKATNIRFLAKRELPEQLPVSPENSSGYTDIATSTKPLSQVIAERREELQLSQVDVARYLHVGASEFIGLVERGNRQFHLNKIPKLAEVLKLDKAALCKLALFESAPEMAMTLFGSRLKDYTPREGAPEKKEDVKLTPQQVEFHRKLWSLSSPLRQQVLSLIEQFYELTSVPGNRLRKG